MGRKQGIPKAHPHRGQARIRVGGQEIYLGPWGSAEAIAKERQMVAEWMRIQPISAANRAAISVTELATRYLRFATTYYRKNGLPTRQHERVKAAITPLIDLYAATPANQLQPTHLKAVREAMVARGWCRQYVNACVGCLKRMWSWGVEEGIVDAETFGRLARVKGLRKGKTIAPEGKKVQPVAAARVRVVLPILSPQLQTMIRLQWYSGMRPGEVTIMRTGDLDRRKPIWLYQPERHKTEHLDQPRLIRLGPRCQKLLHPWFRQDLKAYLFSPAEAETTRNAARRATRRSPLTPSQRQRGCKVKRRRAWRDHWDSLTYSRAISRACDRAFRPPPPLGPWPGESIRVWQARLTAAQKVELKQWRDVHRWHPNQLRHAAATRFRRRFGIETARVLLGHRNAFTTEIYAEADNRKAAQAAARLS